MVWAFGGRLDGLARTCPRDPVQAVALSAPMVYALRIGVPLTFCNLGRVLARVLQRAGHLSPRSEAKGGVRHAGGDVRVSLRGSGPSQGHTDWPFDFVSKPGVATVSPKAGGRRTNPEGGGTGVNFWGAN